MDTTAVWILLKLFRYPAKKNEPNLIATSQIIRTKFKLKNRGRCAIGICIEESKLT
jgi:hypothetical protein